VEIQLLEKHCQNCEICTDIKEGIDSMKIPATLSSYVNEIKVLVDKKSRSTFILFSTTSISIAASIVLVSILFWFLFPSQEQIVLNPEPLNHQNESGVKSPEEAILISPKLEENKKQLSSKKQKNIALPEQKTNISNEVLVDQSSMNESVSSQQEASSNSAIPLSDNQAESDFNVVESKSTETTIPRITQNEVISGSNKESAPKLSSITRKSKSLFEPSSKKQSLPSANNVNISNNNQVELIKDIDLKSSNNKNLHVLQEADILFNELKFTQSLMICDSMMNLPEKPYFTSFVLLKSKIIVINSGKKNGYDFLKEQIKKHKIKDQLLLDYLKILKE
jgi:hypothetical protein